MNSFRLTILPAAWIILAMTFPAMAQSGPPISWEGWKPPPGQGDPRQSGPQRSWSEPEGLPPLQCTGTEPFWSMELTAEDARLSGPGQDDRILQTATPQNVANRSGHWVVPLEDRTGAADAYAVVQEGRCGDGMSDSDDTYDVLLIGAGAEPVAGCCQRLEVAMGPLVDVSPRRAAPGEVVTINGEGFPAGADVMIAAGPPQSDYLPLLPARTDEAGRVRAEVPMPRISGDYPDFLFAIQVPEQGIVATSSPVEVAQGGGMSNSAGIVGTLTREGVECPAMRGDDGRLYTLTGADLGPIGPGDRVRVYGREAQASTCMQGTTISVTNVERLRR